MVDFLVAVAQLLCVLGLIYGGLLVLMHADCVDEMRSRYDPIAGHDWLDKPASAAARTPTPRAPAPQPPDKESVDAAVLG